jgi:hypothetical protein
MDASCDGVSADEGNGEVLPLMCSFSAILTVRRLRMAAPSPSHSARHLDWAVTNLCQNCPGLVSHLSVGARLEL